MPPSDIIPPPAPTPAPTPSAVPDSYTAPDGTVYQRVASDAPPTPPPAPPPAPAPTPPPAPPPAPVPAPKPVVADPGKQQSELAAATAAGLVKLDADGKPVVADPAKPGDPPAEITKGSDYKLTLPDGVTIANDPLLSSFLDTAAANKVSNDAAQAIVSEWAPRMRQEFDTNMQNAWARQITTWQQQTAADPEIGGDALAASVAVTSRLCREYGFTTKGDGAKDNGEIQGFLDRSGAHSNPAFIRMMTRIGKVLGEGSLVAGGNNSPGRQSKDPADVMYPKTATG